MQPSVSVVIPVLNEERFLAQSVNAILNQNYDGQIEVILALGPSIDNTNQVAQDLAKDNRVKLIQNPTGKTAAALNNAIKNSKFEINELRNMVAKLLQKKSQNINITNNNLMLNINSFGNENLSHITINDYKNFFTGFFPGFIKFIEKIHFDENMPENHNICITNLKSNFMFTYNKGKWLSKDKNHTIDTFIAKKYNIFVNKLDELEGLNQIDENILEKFNAFKLAYFKLLKAIILGF